MEPVLAQALSTLIGAITTAILMAAAYYWGPNQRQSRQDKHDHRLEWDEEDRVRKESRHNQDHERDFTRRHINDCIDKNE